MSEEGKAREAIFARALTDELHRRVDALAALGDRDFGGPLSTLELTLGVAAFAIAPAAVVWFFA